MNSDRTMNIKFNYRHYPNHTIMDVSSKTFGNNCQSIGCASSVTLKSVVDFINDNKVGEVYLCEKCVEEGENSDLILEGKVSVN